MGWCWRRCLSEEVGGEDDIGYYPLCWGGFFVILLGGLFFSRLSRDGDDGDDNDG